MRRFVGQLPAAATLGNIIAGVAACALAMAGRPELGALMVLVAVLMDACDGALARSLDAASEFGAQLDSLADVVSFGLAPALIVGSLLPAELRSVGWALLLVYPVCAAWRLARFNTERADPESAHAEFTGLPSTGAGAAAVTAVLVQARLVERGFVLDEMLLPCVLVLLAALMVSRIPYRHGAAIIARLTPAASLALATIFVAGSLAWHYEYLLAALMWGYALSGPLGTAREMIRAFRHA